MLTFNDYIIRMLCAFLMGTLIGVERQYRQRNAGLRTNILVAVGSAAFTVLSFSMAPVYQYGTLIGDPSRIAAQIVTGIGFIGGGLILKDGFTVRGLNTAATIWCSAGCGMLCGVGMIKEAGILVAIILFTHCVFRPLCSIVERKISGVNHYCLRVECKLDSASRIQRLITSTVAMSKDLKVESLHYKEQEGRNIVFCNMESNGEHKELMDLMVTRLHANPDVTGAGWEKHVSQQEDF